MSTIVGIILELGATVCNAGGYTLQKLAHRRVDAVALQAASGAGSSALSPEANADVTTVRAPPLPYYRYWQFGAGLLCCVLAAVLDVVSYGFAAQSQLGPVSATTLVWVALLSWRVLGEPFTRLDAIGDGLMLLGTGVALASSSGEPAADYGLDGVLSNLERPSVAAYLSVLVLIGAAGAFAAGRFSRVPSAELSHRAAAADAVIRPAVAGLLAGSTGLNVKAFVTCLTAAFRNHSGADFKRIQPYIFLVALVTSLVLQLNFLNSGLARYDANRIVPICTFLDFCARSAVHSSQPARCPSPLQTTLRAFHVRPMLPPHPHHTCRPNHARLLPGLDRLDLLGRGSVADAYRLDFFRHRHYAVLRGHRRAQSEAAHGYERGRCACPRRHGCRVTDRAAQRGRRHRRRHSRRRAPRF